MNDDHFIDCRNKIDWHFLKAKMKLESAELQNIYDLLAELGAIHKELWQNKVIWSVNFVENIKDAYKRRNNKCMNFSDLCEHLSIKCKHKYNQTGNNVNRNKESKEEESKGKDSKIKDSNKIDFEIFWDMYDKKVGRNEKIKSMWDKLSVETQQKILNYIPKYIELRPNKEFRKDPQTFFDNESWNDELIGKQKPKKLGYSADKNFKFN